MHLRRWAALLGVAAFVLSCQQAAEEAGEMTEPGDTAAEEQALDALADSYEQSFAAKDADALAGYFTTDAVWIAHDGTRTEGAEGIRALYTTMFESPGTVSIDIQPESRTIAASGDIGHEIGSVTVTATTPDGQATLQSNTYVVLFRKGDDGQWKLSGGMDTAPVAPTAEGETEAAPAGE